MSFKFEAFYLVEPRPELAEHLRGRVESDFADVLLDPQLFRREEHSRTMWFEPQRLAQAKLLFLASLRQYTPLADDAGFAAVFGSAAISVEQFDRWFTVRRFQVDEELNVLEGWSRQFIGRVEPSGVPLVDEWLAEVRGQSAESGPTPDRPR
jgi:hypothetical protein